MTETILIVEDEERLAKLLADYLERAGYATEWRGRGGRVVEEVKRRPPALMLLDLMLPEKDGLQICKEVRTFSDVPIVMVTARVEEIDRLLGLELGADDYIAKPFSPREVVARVKAVLRRARPKPATSSRLLALNAERYEATLVGHTLPLTAVEFNLLSALAARPGHIYSRDQLMQQIYRDQRVVCDRTIDSHVKKLRKKIAEVYPDGSLVHSVYGVGYKYEEP